MRLKSLLVPVLLVVAIPALGQRGEQGAAPKAPPVAVVGVVQSFSSGKYLIVKPANGSAVWITVPAEVSVDRSQLKQGVNVAVEAQMIDTGYLATAVTIQK